MVLINQCNSLNCGYSTDRKKNKERVPLGSHVTLMDCTDEVTDISR